MLKVSFSDRKRYHIFTYMSFSFFNNSVNQGKLKLLLGIMEGKGFASQALGTFLINDV